jgi:gas vesicle protein
MKTGKLFLGVLAGAAVGATLGILFAPDKGYNTRKKIAKKTGAVVGEVEDKFHDVVDGIGQKFEAVKDEAIRMTKKGKHQMEEEQAKA